MRTTMKLRNLVLVLAAGLGLGPLGAVPALAAVERISCPVDQLRGEVRTPLPGGWWSTPMVFSLQDTRVERVRGRTVLTCDYGAAGAIRRDAPSDDCVARRRGFRCNVLVLAPLPIPIPVPAPAPGGGSVHASGGGAIGVGNSFDFDTGATGGPGADIRLDSMNGIAAINGATIQGGFGSNRPGLNGCRAVGGGGSVDLPGPDRLMGFAFCVRTSEGRIAEFFITNPIGGIRFNYTTWNP